MFKKKSLISIIVIYSILNLVACQNITNRENMTSFESIIKKSTINKTVKKKELGNLVPKARYHVAVIPIRYQSKAPDGKFYTVSAALFLPVSEYGILLENNKPLVVYGKGTDPIANSQVEKNFNSKFETKQIISIFAAQGYPLLISDMLGYGSSKDLGYHPYLHSESEAMTTVDGILATYRKTKEIHYKLSDQLFLLGFSQGGHIAASTHRFLNEQNKATYPFKILGASYLSAALDLDKMMSNKDYLPAGYQLFISFFITSLHKVYGSLVYESPYDSFKMPYAKKIEHFFPLKKDYYFAKIKPELTLPLGAILRYIPLELDPEKARNKIFNTEFIKKMHAGKDQNFMSILRENSISNFIPKEPTYVCYGKNDNIVYPSLNSIHYQSNIKNQNSVIFEDINPIINQTYKINTKPKNKIQFTIESLNYHMYYASTVCMIKAKEFLEKLEKKKFQEQKLLQ